MVWEYGCLEWEFGMGAWVFGIGVRVFGMAVRYLEMEYGVCIYVWSVWIGLWTPTPSSIQAAGGSVFGEAGLMPHIEQLWACVRKEVRREVV